MGRLFTLPLVLALAACGFHLQGTAPMPPELQTLYVRSADPYTDFQRHLLTALSDAGARTTEERTAATAILNISKDETGRRVLSVSARNTPREYEIFYTVTYSVTAEGRQLLAPQTLSLTRDYSFDEEAILAKEEEEEILRRALARDLVSIVMRRLSSL